MKNYCFILLMVLEVPLIAQQPELVVPIGHAGNAIQAVSFSPDGQYILTGSTDNSVKIWDLKGKELRTLSGHTDDILSVCFSPDGKTILTASEDGTGKLWDLSGNEMVTLKDKRYREISSAVFTSDGKRIFTANKKGHCIFWDLSGNYLDKAGGYSGGNGRAGISSDGRYILLGSAVFDNTSGHFLKFPVTAKIIEYAPKHDYFLVGGGYSPSLKQHNLAGEEIKEMAGITSEIQAIAIAPDNDHFLSAHADGTIILWDYAGERQKSVFAHQGGMIALAFSPDGKYFLSGGADGTAAIWDLSGNLIRRIEGIGTAQIESIGFSMDGKRMYAGVDSTDGKGYVWDFTAGEILGKETIRAPHLAISPNGKFKLYQEGEKQYSLRNYNGENSILSFRTEAEVLDFAVCEEKQYLATLTSNNSVTLRDFAGKIIHSFVPPWDQRIVLRDLSGNPINAPAPKSYLYSISISDDGQYIVGGGPRFVKIWDIQGTLVGNFIDDSESNINYDYTHVCISPDHQRITTMSSWFFSFVFEWNGTEITKKESTDGAKLSIFAPGKGHSVLQVIDDKSYMKEKAFLKGEPGSESFSFETASGIGGGNFSPDGQYLYIATKRNTILVYNRQNVLLATLYLLGNNDWVVTAPDGLFDATPGAMKTMYYVQGWETIELEQLKERYYEPGLMSKLMRYNQEPLRDVAPMGKELALYPNVTLRFEEKTLHVKLFPREGGVGRVGLFIGNKEIVEDLDPGRGTSIPVDLNRYKDYFIPGEPTTVGVQAWDKHGALKSRLHTEVFTWGTREDNSAPKVSTRPAGTGKVFNTDDARLYALCIGSGDYLGGEALDLSYAEQDAKQMADAFDLAGRELFLGGAPYIKVLTTCKDCPDNAANATSLPSRKNIRNALLEIKNSARPIDVVVLYLSGHGKTYEDYWYYLTYEMTSDVMTDETVRENRTISSKELKDWMSEITAQKQVLIIDACSSGKLNQDFDLLSQKDIPSSQTRALNRLGSRAGLFVISASTADQVSYEASPYGMGLLTYSLLQGISGGALREREYVDINTLFGFSEETVPKLADYINKTQKPMIYAPEGSESFDIGRVTPAVKQNIKLSAPKPIFSRVRFANPDNLNLDDLELSQQVNADLRDYNYKGAKSPLIFVEGDGIPQAYLISGMYAVSGATVTLTAGVFKNRQRLGDKITLTGTTTDLQKLSKTLIKKAHEMAIEAK